MARLFSCVVDSNPKYIYQAWIWASTLRDFGQVASADILINLVEGVNPKFGDWFTELGFKCGWLEPVDPRHPPSNKLAQLFIDFSSYESIVLCDCDLAFVEPPRYENVDVIQAKPVDHGNPSAPYWAALESQTGLQLPMDGVASLVPQPTNWNNVNGGLYVIPSRLIQAIREPWLKWDKWLIEHSEVLGKFSFHIDQVALAMALSELGERIHHLPLRHNLPTHYSLQEVELGGQPVALHFHDKIDANGFLLSTDSPLVNEAIRKVNEHLRDLQQQGLNMEVEGLLRDMDKARAKMNVVADTWGRYDIGEEWLSWALDRSDHPEILGELVNLARLSFGWYTKHLSRSFENPWTFEKLAPYVGKSILDIGAGVSALPLLLASKGASVITVDNSPFLREPGTNEREWDDWGYLDYSYYDPRITSYRLDAAELPLPDNSLDAIYSVSVIEHMPAENRRTVLDRVAGWLKPAGSFVLTIDLIPNTELLWDRAAGQIVEDRRIHGDLQDLRAELESRRLRIEEMFFMRNLPGLSVDVAFLCAKYCSLD